MKKLIKKIFYPFLDPLREIAYSSKEVSKRLNNIEQELSKINFVIRQLSSLPMDSKERQINYNMRDIAKNHLARYYKASEYIKEKDNVLDIACGVGYGSYLMSGERSSANFTGVDISKDTIAYANKHYAKKNIQYICDNIYNIKLKEKFDVCVSFETIEHIDQDVQFIKLLYQNLKKDGLLIISTPNQDLLPFNKEVHTFHIRHYTVKEITDILEKENFMIMDYFCSNDHNSIVLEEGHNGHHVIIVAKKQ